MITEQEIRTFKKVLSLLEKKQYVGLGFHSIVLCVRAFIGVGEGLGFESIRDKDLNKVLEVLKYD